MPINNVGDAIKDWKSGSKHIRTRAQAIAVGLKAEGKSKYSRKRLSGRSSKRSLRRSR